MTDASNKQIRQPQDDQAAKNAEEYLLTLSRISASFARVQRMPRYMDGAKESDVEHSYHLALVAPELAATYFPDLDAGLVSQFCIVHDLPELYAGDTPTFDISDEVRAKKEQAEKKALARLLAELPPHTAQLLERYEQQKEPEARFVRFVDKLLPMLMTTLNGGHIYSEEYGITSRQSLSAVREKEMARFQALFPEFPFIQIVYSLVSDSNLAAIFPEDKFTPSRHQ